MAEAVPAMVPRSSARLPGLRVNTPLESDQISLAGLLEELASTDVPGFRNLSGGEHAVAKSGVGRWGRLMADQPAGVKAAAGKTPMWVSFFFSPSFYPPHLPHSAAPRASLTR